MNDEFPSECSIKTKLKGKKKFLLYKVDKNSGWESLKGNGFHVGSHV
jgi:c-di-GMP-related signal transduction protein